jgi:hypothetical protein
MAMHGVLWVFDQLFDGRIVDGGALAASLTALSGHPRCRLPKADVQMRFTIFAKSKGLGGEVPHKGSPKD